MGADAVLLRCAPLSGGGAIPNSALLGIAREANLPFVQMERWVARDGSSIYSYFWLEPITSVPDKMLASIQKAAGEGSEAIRLSLLEDREGVSSPAQARFHYVVETDVEPAAEADFNAWYKEEHLPGLAAVPGTVRARRLRSLDGAPRYHACYELVSDRILASEPWLAVRHTSWSDRVRPNFRNTRRVMFSRSD
jgi:hypothetical protein